jgi:hypothetical protein
MSDISEKLLSQARQSSTKLAERIKPDTAFSYDASQSQRRQANHCFGAFMDCKQQKFVDFKVVSRSFGREKKFVGDFDAPAKQWSLGFYSSRRSMAWAGRDHSVCV